MTQLCTTALSPVNGCFNTPSVVEHTYKHVHSLSLSILPSHSYLPYCISGLRMEPTLLMLWTQGVPVILNSFKKANFLVKRQGTYSMFTGFVPTHIVPTRQAASGNAKMQEFMPSIIAIVCLLALESLERVYREALRVTTNLYLSLPIACEIGCDLDTGRLMPLKFSLLATIYPIEQTRRHTLLPQTIGA